MKNSSENVEKIPNKIDTIINYSEFSFWKLRDMKLTIWSIIFFAFNEFNKDSNISFIR